MNMVCREGCFDRDPLCVSVSPQALWLKCSVCGELNTRLRQEPRGVVWQGSLAELVVDCSGEINNQEES